MKTFSDWAKNIYIGGEGGNPSAPTWFCGIEPGGDIKEATGVDNPSIDTLISLFIKYRVEGKNHCAWSEEFIDNNPSYSSWQFLQKVAKISLASLGRDISTYKKYMETEFLRSGSDQFHLNLYPLNFVSTDHSLWGNVHQSISGMASKSEYISWCRQNRFPAFKDVMENVKDKVIVCSGINNTSDFISAFVHSVTDQPLSKEVLQMQSKKDVTIYRLKSRNISLFITPFLGQGGLMADADFIQLGEKIRKEHDSFC